MSTFVALSVSALAYGAALALTALGFLVLYKATGVVNFAHGDLVTLGGYLALWFIADLHAAPLFGYLGAVILMFGIGVVLERVAFAPLRRRPHLTVLIATLAAALVLRAAISLWQGSTPRRLPSPADDSMLSVFGTSIAVQRVVVIVVAAVCIGGVALLFTRTGFGRQLRAMSSDRMAAELYGVATTRVSVVAWGLSAAGLAGILIAPLSALDVNFGFTMMLAAFAAAVLGGFDGQDVHGWAPARLAKAGLIHVPEGRHVFPTLTVHENLQMGDVARAGRWVNAMGDDRRMAPAPTTVTQPYWSAAGRREFVVQRCLDCVRFVHPPAEWCRFCGSARRTFEPVSGRGEVETFSVVHRTFAPGFAGRVPYVIAWIALDEQAGLRVFGNVLETPASDVRIGMRVEATFENVDGFGPVPNFRPSKEERSCASA